MIIREVTATGDIAMPEFTSKKLRIGVLTNIPAPYRKPMWEADAKNRVDRFVERIEDILRQKTC